MYKLIKAADATVRRVAENKIVANFITKEISPEFSFATIKATNYSETETTPYTRVYYVLEGALSIAIDGQNLELEAGDVCYIEKDSTYEMQGTFQAIVINQPAFGS